MCRCISGVIITVTIDGAIVSRYYGSRHVHGRTGASWRVCVFRLRHDAAVSMWLQSALNARPGERGHVMEVWPVRITVLRQCSQVGVSPGRCHSNSRPSRHEGAQLRPGNLLAHSDHSREDLVKASLSSILV